MAGDQIREYVIKIRAEVKDALAQIDQLKGKFDKVELKTNVDKSFGQQIEKLSGSIGKITQEMGELKTSFKDVDFKSFTGDMKQSFDELKTSIDDIKNSAKTLSEAFDFSGNGKQNSLTSFVTDLKQQMSDLLNSYTETANKLKDLQDSGFTIPQIDTSGVGSSIGSVQTQLQQAQNELDDFKKLADVKKQTLDLIKEIAQAQKKDQRYIDMAASEDSPMSGGAYQPSDYSRARDQLARLQDLLKVTGEIKDVKDALKEAGLSQSEISKAKNALGKRVDAILKESIAEINPSAEPQRMRIQFNYDIAESDDKDVLKQKAIEIAQKIQSEVQQIIQDEVSKNPIKIPLSIGASDSELLDEQNKNKVLEAIEIPVKPITDGLLEDINTKIQDISDQVATIDVKINPILPDNIKADKINWDVSKITDSENAIQGEGKAAEIAAKQKDLFRQANANIAADTPKTTEAVKAATKAIEAAGKTSAKGTGKIAPNVIPASSFVDNPTIHVENATIIDDSSNQQKTQDNIMYGPSDRQIITDGDFGVDPPRKKRKYLSQILAPTAMKGRTTLDQMSAFWEGNDYSDVKKTSKELFNYAMESLFKDIQASKRTKDDILGRDYYTKGITVNDHTYAFYGKPGQTLEDFQGQILDVFTLAREAIGRYKDDLHETMQQERKVSSKDDLVDSGVDGRKVTPWMKRIIDADKKKEQNELRADQIKKMIQENEANDPKFIEKAKDGFLKEFDESIDSLKRQRDEIIKENKEYSDLNRQFSDTKRILPQISSSKSRDNFATWYGGLRDDSNAKKIADMFSAQSLLDPNNDFDKTRTEISNAIASYLEKLNAELGSQAQIFEKNKQRLERIDKSIENTTITREQMANANKPDVMKEVVRRRHQTARVSLVDANENGLTTEFEKELQDIEKKEIKRYTTQVARKAIRNQIEVVDTNRRSGLVSDLKDKFQKYKNQNESSFNSADSSQRSQLIQKFVNENRKLVEDIQAENQFLRAVRGELPEDKLDQNKLYIERGKDNSQLRKNGFGVDALRKPNEKGVSIIDVKNEQSLKLLRKLEESGWFVDERTGLLASSSGKVVKTKNEGSDDLYDRIMDIGRYGQERLDQQIAITEALAENEHLIRSYIEHYEDTIKNGGYNEEGTLAVGSQIGELDQSTLTSNLIEKFPNLKSLNPQQMYEFAQEYMDELSDSRKKQIEITDNIKDVITKTVDIQMKRKITEEGYNEAIKELGEVDHEIVALENRMEKVSGKVTSLNLKTGKEKVTYGVDPRTVTPFEQQRYYDLKSRQRDLRGQIFGYEMSQGMRSWSGALINKQSLDVLRKNNGRVINYGLPSELSERYSKIPDPNSVSKPFIDKDGIQINGMREAVGLTTDQLREFVTTLQVTNEGIRESLGKFPQTSEEIQAYVDRHVKEDIDSLVSVRNSMVQELKTRFEEYKKQHEEEFMLADTTQKTELTKNFIKGNRGLVKDISSSNKATRMLRDDEPIAQTAKILSNDKKIDELNARQDELSKIIIEQISDSGDSAVFMKEELSELSRLREYESGARKELDDYAHEYATDRYSRGKIEEDEGYIERRDYYETIRNKRKQAEKKVIGRLPLKDDLYKTETGSLGQTQNSSRAGSAIEELLDVIERREQLESDNFALRQIIGSDTKTARSEREEVWRENLKSQREDLEGAIKQNEYSIKQFEQLIQNDAEVKKRDVAIKERQQSEEALRQRKAEKFQEISVKASTPKEQLLAQVTAEKDAISVQLSSEISTLRTNLDGIVQQIETVNTELSSELDTKKGVVTSLKKNIEEMQQKITEMPAKTLQDVFDQDETINELQNKLQSVRASGASYRNIRTIENQIANRENEIISEYSNKIIDDIYAIQDAIDENASEDTIRQLSNNLLLSHRQYQSAFGKEYAPEDVINGNQDPIKFAKEHGDLEEHIIHTNQSRLVLAEEDVKATEARLKESQEALDVVKGISKTATEENKLAQQYIATKRQLDDKEVELRTENQKRLEEIDYINKGDQKTYESLLVRQNGLDQSEYNNWKNGSWNEEKYSKENVERKIAGEKKTKELEHEEAIIRKQEIMEKQIAERLRYEQVLQDKEAKDESKKQKGQTSSSQPKNSQRKQDEYLPQYIPDEYEKENYDAYNKMYESEQGLTRTTIDTSLATDEAIRKEQELAQASDSAATSVKNLSDKVIEFADAKSKINEKEASKQEQKAASPQKALANKAHKLEPPKITKDGIDFNGNHYSLLPENQRINTRSSKGLKAIYDAASKRGRISWTPKNAVKYLDAYSMTGNQDFLLGLESSMQKGQKTATLKTEYKNEIKKFISEQLTNQIPVSSTTSTEQKIDIQPAIKQQNQLQAELSETTAKAQEASGAINSLNDSMITFETDATKGAKLSSEKLPVLSDNGRVLGASKRNNIPYSIEEFENNQGLAEKVLAANGPKFNTDYWAQSKANAQEYINTAKEAVAVTQQVQGQLQDNSKAVDSSSAQAEASRSSADSMANEAAAAKEAESALLAKAAAEQQAAESSRQLAQASQQSADTAKLQVEAPKVVPQASVEKQTKTTVKMSQPQLSGDTTTLPGAETESGSFSGLVTTLTQTIPQAVATKNEAFKQELFLVQNVASQEAQAFDQLISKLEKIAGLATNFKFDFSIQGGEQFTSDFLDNFAELKTEIDGIDPTRFQAVGDAFSGIGKSLTNKKDLSQYFIDLGTAIKTFSESMNTIDISDNFSNISNLIDKISNAGSALKNALTIIKQQKSAYDFKYGTDQETDQQVKDALKQAQYLSTPNNVSKATKYGIQYAQFNAGDTSKALTAEQYTWWEDYKRQSADFENSFSSLQSSLKLTADGYDALSDAMNRLNDNRESSIRGMAIEEQKTKDFSNQLRGMQERINQIPEEEKQAYAGAVGRLQNRFDEASQGLSSGKLVWQEYTEQMKAAWKEYERFKRANPAGSIQLMSGVTGSSEDVMKQIQSTLSQRYKLVTQNVSGGAIDSNGMARFSAQVVDANNNVQNLKITWDTFNNTVSATANTASEQFKGRFMSLISDLQAKSKQLFVYWTATFLNPYRLIGFGKQVINIVKELDTAMMELRKVSSESAESYQDFQQKSFDMADQVGGTAKDIIQATTNWKKLGKSFEESQEAGQASVKLLNVSEFTNIEDATTALVSMKQAFKDLTYDDFIDKVNAVGDSYSSSTDQLSEGMKNISAVMKVQGNDIDQTLALLTAANDITQDISKASMGARTVALRMSGTQEAKQQLEDLGEDTSDFIVQTQSKVDSQVRKYTATSSNPNGISVLDDNGRLRDTYDVLLDISKVWDEIVAKDEEFGTNTSNALLELLAGKTRSNVLASILQNPELLENAYETSKNAKGTGQKELDIYLDSVQAKTTQITNNLQQLSSATIDTDSFKTFLDLINSILTGVNSLAEAFGGLNLAISAIAGFQLQKHGLGKQNCFPESQLVNKNAVFIVAHNNAMRLQIISVPFFCFLCRITGEV